jgi:hypothetical protein
MIKQLTEHTNVYKTVLNQLVRYLTLLVLHVTNVCVRGHKSYFDAHLLGCCIVHCGEISGFHGDSTTSQKSAIFILIAMKILNLKSYLIFKTFFCNAVS